MRPDLHKYPKEEIAGAFRDYMDWVELNEGTHFVHHEQDIETCTENKIAQEIIRTVRNSLGE